MNEKTFWEYVEHEINWLSYYARKDFRLELNEQSNIYDDLKAIVYVKRQMPLDLRCAKCVLTSEKLIEPGLEISDLTYSSFPRKENVMTPLEVAMRIFPSRKNEFLEKLKPKESNHTLGFDPKLIRK